MPRKSKRYDNWDEDILAYLSTIAPTDPARARIWWDKYAPTYHAGLLDALPARDANDMPQTIAELDAWIDEYYAGEEEKKREEEKEKRRGLWAAGLIMFFFAGYYYYQSGKPASWRSIDDALTKTIDKSLGGMGSLWEQLRTGKISLAEWQELMAASIKDTHLAAAALQRGGLDKLSDADRRTLSRLIRDQLGYLLGFAARIAAGQPIDGRVLRVMKMYLWAARGTFYYFETQQMEGGAYTHYENIITAKESCGGCITQANKGIVPIGELVPIGYRDCLSHCKCYFVYYTIGGETDDRTTP